MLNHILKILSAAVFFVYTSLWGVIRDDLPEHMELTPELPSWVQPLQPNTHAVPAKGATSDGVWYLISDQQTYPAKELSYSHYAVKLFSSEGVEDYSSVSVSIDPDYQKLHWHKLQIIRNDAIIDLLPTQQYIQSDNQSSSSDRIYDNTKEFLAIVEGTQKDDILEYAYSIQGRNPITGDKYSSLHSLAYSSPVDVNYTRIVQDRNEPALRLKLLPETFTDVSIPQARIVGDTRIYEIRQQALASLLRDQHTPSNFISHPYLQSSNWDSWNSVAQWAYDLYDWEPETNDTLEALIDRLKTIDDKSVAALEALSWVQEEIRYVGIMVGPHNYQPYPINTTLQRRFGDCKDKSQLLSYILRRIDIESSPALVHSYEGGLTPTYEPTPQAFDHVITYLKIDEQTYWLDPTASNQGGPLAQTWLPRYEWALVIDPTTTQLTPIAHQGVENSTITVLDRYEMDDYSGAIQFTSTSTYTGSEADYLRGYFQRNSTDEITKDYLNFFASSFPTITPKETVQHQDDWLNNQFVTIEKYSIENGWTLEDDDVRNTYFYVFPEVLSDALFVSDTRIRSMPAVLSYPQNYKQIIEILLPEPGEFENDTDSIITPWFEFSYQLEVIDSLLRLTYSYKNLADQVPAADYPEYAALIEKVHDRLGFSIYYPIGDDEIEDDTIYLPVALSAGYSATIGLLLALYLATRKRRMPKVRTDSQLDGFGGWLVLPTLDIIASPFINLGSLIEYQDCFNDYQMQFLTDPNSSSYIEGFLAALIVEITWCFAVIPISIALAICFFRKRAITRPFYICVLVANLIYVLIDNQLCAAFTEPGDLEGTTALVRAAIAATIWISYFAVSKRVKATFRH